MNENPFYVDPFFRNKNKYFDLITLQPIAIGTMVIPKYQKPCNIAIGRMAGIYEQGECAIAIGDFSGTTKQGFDSISLGNNAGTLNQGNDSIAMGNFSGSNNQGNFSIAIGSESGENNQSENSISIGFQSGKNEQGAKSIAIGYFAGSENQGNNAIAIGNLSGQTNQTNNSIIINASGIPLNSTQSGFYVSPISSDSSGEILYYNNISKQITRGGIPSGNIPSGSYFGDYLFWNSLTTSWCLGTSSISLGRFAGEFNQSNNSVALGFHSGQYNQDISNVAIGSFSGYTNQGREAIAIGLNSGGGTQGMYSVSIGSNSGYIYQGTSSISIGNYAGQNNQGQSSIAIGSLSAQFNQGISSISIGSNAGISTQGNNAIAIGTNAGSENQGNNAIAIGSLAGQTNQPNNSIIINASGSNMSTTTQPSALYINPIRNTTGSKSLYYEPSTKEITYSDIIPGTLNTYPYNELQATDSVIGKFMLTDCADKDAFYRLRVSNPLTLFDGNTVYNSNLTFFDNDINGNASITGPNNNAAMTLTLNSGSTLNDYAARQTHFYTHYQPGKSLMALFSFCFNSQVLGITKRVGLYDVDNSNYNNPLNGILLEKTDSGLYWKIYKGDGTFQSAEQSNWNVDSLDGNGPSGIILNQTNNLLGFIDLEWLGVGRVRVGFFINGVPVICNTFNNSQFNVPYLNNPYLPVRYEIRRTQNILTTTNSFTSVCCSVTSEGGYEPLGITRTFRSGQLSLSSTQIKYCLAIRLKSSYPRSSIRPVNIEIVSDLSGGSNIAYYSIFLWRPSSMSVPSTTTWTSVSNTLGGSGSIVEYSNPGESGATDLYTQMVNDISGQSILIEMGSVNSISKSSLITVNENLLIAQSNVNKLNRDIYLITIDNNSSGTNVKYTSIFTWREL